MQTKTKTLPTGIKVIHTYHKAKKVTVITTKTKNNESI